MTKVSRTRRNRRQLTDAYHEQDGLCIYCDEKCWLPWEAPGDRKLMATREHIVRRCDGGTNADENIAMACADCNSRRGETPPAEWLDARAPADPIGEVCVQFGSYDIETPGFDPTAHFFNRKTSQTRSK